MEHIIELVFLSGFMACANQVVANSELYSVVELDFQGPEQDPTDTPVRDIDFWALFRHESGSVEYKIHGFWDGDGKGGISGNIFKIRFCPTETGRWDIVEVYSNVPELSVQRQGEYIEVVESKNHGFWIAEPDSPGQRWYMRSDGSHQYIFGNTQYSFLSGYKKGKVPSGNDIIEDIKGNSEHFKKLRFSLYGDHYPNPVEKPFLDDSGTPTDWGDYSHRPNPKWFHERADLAVQTANDLDLIADLILAGPDREESRSTLRATHNDGDPAPFLKYIAARYASYPNVWICLCNEYDIPKSRFVINKPVVFSEDEIAQFGQIILQYMPYKTPLSVHNTPMRGWASRWDELPDWYDHIILQKKLKDIAPAADNIQNACLNPDGNGFRNKPIINDELSYQGEGDGHIEGDTIESHLGAFLGGGYGTTGEKPGDKTGQYFRGKFDPAEHTAAVSLKWLREVIDASITFWKMSPDLSIFSNLDPGFRGMAWPEHEYVLGTDKPHKGVFAHLPAGKWLVTRYDVVKRESEILSTKATGDFAFDAPDSRAVLFHLKRISKIR